MFHILLGMLLTIIVHENQRGNDIMMFGFADGADKARGLPKRFPIMGSRNLLCIPAAHYTVS
jgi:hypothetical protein